MKPSIVSFYSIILTSVLYFNTASSQQRWDYSHELKAFKRIQKDNDSEVLKKYFEDAIPRIRQENWKHRNLGILLTLKLADINSSAGDFAAAERLYMSLVDQVRHIRADRRTSRLPLLEGTIYDAYDRLGYFYLKTGNLRRAEQLFTESQSSRESVFPKRSVFRIHPIVGLGSLHYRKGDFDKATDFFLQASAMLTRATTSRYDYDKVRGLFLYDLAEIFIRLEKTEEARKYISKLSISSSGFGKFRSRVEARMQTARILELRSRLFMLDGDFRQSQLYLDRANKFYPGNIIFSDLRFKLLKTQALLFRNTNQITKAAATWLEMSKMYREHINRNFIAMSEYEKEQFYNVLKQDLRLFNAFSVSHHDRPENSVLFEEIYNNTLNTKALLLNESNRIKNNILRSEDSGLIARLKEWESAKARLSSIYYDRDGSDNIDSLEVKIESLENAINLESGLFTHRTLVPTWESVRASLGNEEAAVEIIRINEIGKSHLNNYGMNRRNSDSTIYLALIVKKGIRTPEYVLLKHGNQMERKFLAYYRNCVLARVDDRFSYNEFWMPIKKYLTGIKRVFVSPDGAYNQLNLNTLRNPETGEYLIDEIELICVTNTGDLLKDQSLFNGLPTAVLFGRPLYNTAGQSGGSTGSDYYYGARNILTEELANFTEQDFADLPGTEAEILKIAETLDQKGVNVKTYLRDEALEENVKAIQSPLILHIATHGFFVDDSASVVHPMIRSGLVMAGVENREAGKSEDGILTAYEATNLDLQTTSLVALSACETGIGEVRNGQGVYGLQRAIITAGAQNLLMSLWKVDDEATAELMVEFYRAWKQNANQTAFRTAQQNLRKKYPQPFFWGAFIMLGK